MSIQAAKGHHEIVQRLKIARAAGEQVRDRDSRA
jgi:hypothetical protein